MADFYFFADYDLLEPQTYGEEFAHTSYSAGYSKHRMAASANFHPQTSTFFPNIPVTQFSPVSPNVVLAQKISPAYAICSGRVFVFNERMPSALSMNTAYNDIQQTATIILQPSEQPLNGLPKIKYFIYKRILLNSLVDAQGKVITDGRDNGLISPFYNNLTSKIHDSLPVGGTAFSNTLDNDYGLSPTITIEFLDEIFHRDNPSSQTFQVCGGETIGYFPQSVSQYDSAIRIGIILDDVDGHFTHADIGAYGSTHTLYDFLPNVHYETNFNNVSAVNSQVFNSYTSQSEQGKYLHFLDPCAFYGSFANNNFDRVFARKFDDNFTLVNRGSGISPLRFIPEWTLQTSNTIYENLLSKFYNKNKIYIDIRNPENKQLNFYDNYNEDVLLRVQNPSSSPPYNIYNNLSPIKASDNTSTTRNTNYIVLDPSFFGAGNATHNRFDIALPDGKSHDFIYENQTYTAINNEFPSAYVDRSYLQSPPTDGEFPASRFVKIVRNANTGFASTIKLRVRNYAGDLQQPISTYIRINYLKEQDTYILPKPVGCSVCDQTISFPNSILAPDPDIDRTLRSYEYLDNFFTPFGMLLPQLLPNTPPTGIASNIYYDPKFLDNTRVGGNCMMAYPGIAQDSSGRITLFATAADGRTPPLNMVESGISLSGMVSSSTQTFLSFIATNYTGLNYESHMLSGADIGESVDRFGERITSTKDDKRSEALAWLTIEANDFERLKNINKSRVSSPYTDPVTLNTYTADFIVPSKTYLGLRIATTGQARDIATGNNVDYIKYEFVLRNETLDMMNRIVFKSINTGVYTISLRVLGRDINDEDKFPDTISNSVGVFIDETQPNLEYRIRSTVYLLPDANIKPDELYEFMQHVQCNIRQVWTNRNDMNPETGMLYNCGKYNWGLYFASSQGALPTDPVKLIDAEQVKVVIGTGKDTESLAPGTIAFRVAKKGIDEPRGRAYTTFPAQVGLLFYKPVSPLGSVNRTRYVDTDLGEENTPAHEFGHHMGLTDRYTSTGVINPADYSTLGTFEGNKPMYMQDFPVEENGNSFDPDFITRYNWANNIYTTGETVYGSTILPTPNDMLPMKVFVNSKVEPEDIYQDELQNVFVPTNANAQLPPRYGRIFVFITPKQWELALTYIKSLPLFRQSEAEVSSAASFPAYFVSEYIFFKDYNLRFPAFLPQDFLVTVSEIGFKVVSPGDFVNKKSVSDLRYKVDPPGNINSDKIHELRIRQLQPPAIFLTYSSPEDNAILGYFSPYTDVGSGSINRRRIEKSTDFQEDVTNSGLGLVQDIINDTEITDKREALKAALPGWSGLGNVIDLRILDPYANIGDGNAAGRGVWNYFTLSLTATVGIFTVFYFERPARLKIILRIQGVS